jgi:putative ABC transport system permease protein
MKFYNLLLRLYPASFRNEYASEMRPIFARRLKTTSGIGVIGLWLSTVGEILFNAVASHLDILRQDLSYTGRMLRRAPGFAITAVVVVTLGIGATTAAFSVTDFVLFRPLPFPEPHRLVKLWETTPGYPRMELSAPNYRDWKRAASSYETTGMYYTNSVTVRTEGEPQRIPSAAVTADVFPTLRVAPMLGRTFTADDDREGAVPTAILNYRYWQTEFGGELSALGRTITVNSEAYTVIGVMPREFHFPESDVLIWITTRFGESWYQDSERSNNWVEAVGRLRPGVTLQQSRAEADTIAAQWRARFPKENKDTAAAVVPLGTEVSQRSRLLLMALFGAAACLLLIACANLANLLLARALARRRELAVRAAIGAGRERLIRQLMTESLLLAFAGGALGIAVAFVAVPLLSQLVPQTLPIAATPSIDLRVLLFAVIITAVTGVVFGLAPVLRGGANPDLDGLREGARAGGGQKEGVRSALVIAEIVASVVLLVTSGLLIRALLTVQGTDPGFNPENVLTMRSELPMGGEFGLVAKREAFYSRVLQEVEALPGVRSAGFISFLPMSSFRGGIWPVAVKGDTDPGSDTRSANNVAGIRYVTQGYFDALGIPLKRGRFIAETDNRDRQFVAVVSESFVRRYWPNMDPIGQLFTFASAEREVVGVVGDVRFRGLERVSEPQVYLSSQQVNDNSITFYAPRTLAVRTSGDPAKLTPAVRDIVRRAAPAVPITQTQTLIDLVDLETASRAVQVRVLTAFALIAFVLAAVGIHGLLAFAVSQRTQEIGVRIALGAQSRDILSMVVRRGVILALVGVVPGLVLAYFAGRSMEALLAGVKPADTMTFVSAIVLTLVMTVLGTLAPTLRALRVDPISALRAE